MRKLIGLLISLFLLSGCFESSLVIGPVIGGAQGKLAQSSVSSVLSYGVKYKTGKSPIQHILKRKKEKKENSMDKNFNSRKDKSKARIVKLNP